MLADRARRASSIALHPLRRARRRARGPASRAASRSSRQPRAARPRRAPAAGASRGCSGSRRSTTSCERSACTRRIHNALLALVVDSLATLFPATPGGAGTKQGLIVFLFRGEAISKSLLLAFSVGMNIALVVFNLVLGADRAVPDGAHDLAGSGCAPRRRQEPSERRRRSRRRHYAGPVPFASIYPLVTARAVARAFTYEVEEGVGKGAIVSMPFGRRRARGIVVARRGAARRTGSTAVPIDAVVGQVPPALVDLALWLADYYGSTPARALALVAPELAEAAQGAGAAGRAAVARRARTSPSSCSPEQRGRDRADRRRDRRRRGGAFLLYGATGSGKTEVYLQACAAVLERGLGAIVLVPEIALAPQTVGRVRARFGDRVAILHSGLTEAERRDERERIASGEARIVVGARSAVFAPVRGPRPDRRRRGARRLVQAGLRPALRRAHARRQARGARGRGRRLRLGDAAARELGGARAARARRPRRPARCRRCRSSTCAARPATRSRRRCSRELRGGRRRRRQGDPAPQPPRRRARAALPRLRRARSAARTATSRSSCTATAGCAATTAATPSRRPATCPDCGSAELARLGAGTQRLERELAREFPELELIRLDADTAAKPGADRGGAAAASPRRTAPCCSARRWSRRATTSPASSSRRSSTPTRRSRCRTSAPRSARSS